MRFTQKVKSEEKVNLDVKDKKILFLLADEARMPCTQIAKKVGLSKDAVKYRINKLESQGVIQGYLPVVDTTKLGFITYHMFLQLAQPSKEIRKKIISILKSIPSIRVIIEFSGKYDFEISISARTVQELDDIITQITTPVSELIQEYQVLIISKNHIGKTFPKTFLQMKINKKKKPLSKVKVDKKDIGILKALSKNAMAPLYKIGGAVGLSPDAVNYRLKKLDESKVLFKNVPIINYSLIGYTIYAVLMNSTAEDNRIRAFMRSSENIIWAVKTIGKYNLLMYVCVKESNELHDTLIELRELFPSKIKDYEVMIAYEEYEYNMFPPVCSEISNK